MLTFSRYANLNVNYMTIPVYAVGAVSLLTVVYLSNKFMKRGMCILGCLGPVTIGYLIAVGTANKQAGYAAMFILVLGKFHLSLYTAPHSSDITPEQISIPHPLSPSHG